MATSAGRTSFYRSVRGSILGGLGILIWDGAVMGSFLTALLVCPVWFVVSVVKNLIQRPGWRVALVRVSIPALALGLLLANNQLQWRIAETNASRVVAACEAFHAANGSYPQNLDELVPTYLPEIPRAKYCLVFGEFRYYSFGSDSPILVWFAVPPYGRKIYNFEERRWSYLD
ncbi:MAG: hypothetical protein ACOY3P_18525 [Planctomycetota bacterium]